MVMKKTAEDTLREKNIMVDELKNEKPLLYYHILQAMHKFAQQAVEERDKEIEVWSNVELEDASTEFQNAYGYAMIRLRQFLKLKQ